MKVWYAVWIMVTLGTLGVNDNKSLQKWPLWSDSCPKQLFYKGNVKNFAQFKSDLWSDVLFKCSSAAISDDKGLN